MSDKEVMKSISESLGMNPLIIEDKPKQEQEVVEYIEPEIVDLEPSKEDKEAEEDFYLARRNYTEILEKGNQALDEMLRIASASEHPRAFEVASKLISDITKANSELLKLHEQRRQLMPVPEPETQKKPDQVTNNLFVGTTAELLQMIKEQKKLKKHEELENDNNK